MLKKKGAKIAAIAAAAFIFSASCDAGTSCPENNAAAVANGSANHCVENKNDTDHKNKSTDTSLKTDVHNKCGSNGCGGKNQCSSNGCASKK